MEWLPAIFGFVGALIGATVPSLLQIKSVRGIRLQDAYADLAGASALLLRTSIDASFGGTTADEAWIRFVAAKGRVLLQENDLDSRLALETLAASFETLYSTRVPLHGGAATMVEGAG